MSSIEPKSNRVRNHGHDSDESVAEPASKIQRPNSPPPEAESLPTKMTDLDDDCLEHIFDCLDFHSLLNVALANEWLRPTARIVYKRKFENRIIEIHRFDGHLYTFGKISVDLEKVSIRDLKTCLQFLRCFGPRLTNVHIHYGGSYDKRFDYIHQYINKYCAGNLLKIGFGGKTFNVLIKHKSFDKPFFKVHTLTVRDCDLYDDFKFFSQWFPNIRILNLQNILTGFRLSSLPLFNLEHACIDIGKSFTKIGAAYFLQSSCQLRSLDICTSHGMTLNTLLNIIKEKPAMEKLKLIMDSYCPIAKPMEIQRLVIEHPRLIELNLKSIKFSIDSVLDLIRQLDCLKIFYFQLKDHFEYSSLKSRLDDNQWQPNLYLAFPNRGRIYVELRRQN